MKTTILLLLMMLTLSVFSQETVTIGTQTWMKQNLNTGIMGIDKDCYNNLESNCAVYGGLYGWDQLMITNEGDQGICPTGFHIPTKAEARQLDVFLGGIIQPDGQTSLSGTGGQKLKEAGYSHWTKMPMAVGTDAVGFTMLPSGYKYGTYYSALKTAGYFWTSTSMYNGEGAWFRVTSYYKTNLGEYGVWKHDNAGGKASKLSVRCIKN
jgi:uncharacterized protein (TIGR02145 family)